MTDLIDDLLAALKPFDTSMSHWEALRPYLPAAKFAVSVEDLDRALYAYVSEQIIGLRMINGSAEADAYIDDLAGEPLKNILIQAGRLHPSRLVDALIVYAAHLAALTSYRGVVWRRACEAVVVVAAETALQEGTR